MTRINLVAVDTLMDQHLMAEYRELPMVTAASRRSNPGKYVPRTKYILGQGHVSFFYDKKLFLQDRYAKLVAELRKRRYTIDPDSRDVDFDALDRFPQNKMWWPLDSDIAVNRSRIESRIALKPQWYKYYGRSLIGVDYAR